MNQSGIYLIVCLENNCVYVGRSKEVKIRLFQHFHLLERNKHHNKKLQSDYNQYGIEKFEAQYVEEISDIKKMKDAEQKWLAKYKQNYNSKIGRNSGIKKFKYIDKTK